MSEEFSGSDIWNFAVFHPPELRRFTILPKRHRTSEQLPCPSSSGDLIGILYGLDWTASMEWGLIPAAILCFRARRCCLTTRPSLRSASASHRPRLGDVTNVEEKRF